MTTYVAFLRAINVGGQNLIKMKDLAQIFAAAGCQNVQTYIQSGNVIFDSKSNHSDELARKIERTIQQTLSYKVPVILRTLSELEALIARNPFRKIKTADEAMPFVVFFSNQTKLTPKLPLRSIKENVELFEIENGAAFVVVGRQQNGRSGSPNAVVEKELGAVGTTRNWNTINKIVEFRRGARSEARR
jgi:uncharacterized protein (DUF1697 family)